MSPAQGFWMERALRLQQQHQLLGPAVLVYGCRSQQSDYQMEDMNEDMNDMVAAGALSQVLVAFSREKGVPKTYVQVGGASLAL
jgi:sulfite reductase alpha subunit-like flavoprotein